MKRSLGISILAAGVLAALAWYGAYLSTPGTASADPFAVAKGDSTDAIVDGLKARGIVRSRLLFKYALARSGMAAKLQPGAYDLRGADSYDDIIRALAKGGVAADEFVLLVKEGWDLGDIKKELERLDYGRAGELFEVTGRPATDHRSLAPTEAARPMDFSAEFPFLAEKPSYVSLEGFLFPDTYRIYRDATPEEVVRTLLANFGRRVSPGLRSRIAAANRSLFDVVTLASIVELEVRTPEDRRKVADIFWRRLGAGMPLQADSTVNYVTGKRSPAASYEDTRTDSRYNTYKYPGLPLGPVGNPGLGAIEATVAPLANDYWYFLTDAAGNVHYAKTLEEHNRNKARYLR